MLFLSNRQIQVSVHQRCMVLSPVRESLRRRLNMTVAESTNETNPVGTL